MSVNVSQTLSNVSVGKKMMGMSDTVSESVDIGDATAMSSSSDHLQPSNTSLLSKERTVKATFMSLFQKKAGQQPTHSSARTVSKRSSDTVSQEATKPQKRIREFFSQRKASPERKNALDIPNDTSSNAGQSLKDPLHKTPVQTDNVANDHVASESEDNHLKRRHVTPPPTTRKLRALSPVPQKLKGKGTSQSAVAARELREKIKNGLYDPNPQRMKA